MKKQMNFLWKMLLMFSVLLFTSLRVNAASISNQDGLQVEIKTDKDDYSKTDTISISINIKNTNSYDVADVDVKTLIPDGLVVKTGNTEMKGIDIKAGESYLVSIEAMLSEENNDNEIVEPTPDTGDDSNAVLWIVICAVSAGALVLTKKYKKGANVLSILLCVAMVGSVLPANVFAQDGNSSTTMLDKDIKVDKVIKVDGKAYTISATIDYKIKQHVQLQPVIKLQDSDVFTYSEADDKYTLSGVMNTLSGTMTNYEGIKDAYFRLNFNGKDVVTYVFTPGEVWNISNFGALPGENILKFYMTDVNNKVWEQSITVICLNDSNISAVIKDTTSDKDTDGLPDYIEELYGTDPNSVDTDKDGIPDDVEAMIPGCDARKFDTDGDGTSDGEEDADKDKVSNAKEIAEGTDPCKDDTDGDGLSDYEELNTHHTSPIKADTDGDGLEDGWEVDNGKNPLVAEEKVSANETLQMGESVAEIEAELPGVLAQTLTMSSTEEDILNGQIPGKLSEAVSLNVAGSLPESGATLKFTVADTYPATSSSDFMPVIYYFNPQTEMLEEVPTTYNNHVAEAHLEHFSNYILLNKKVFDEVWDTEIKPPNYETVSKNIEMVFVIDSSGSMDYNDYNDIRIEVAKKMVSKFSDNDCGAVIKFSSSATLLQRFTTDKDLLISAISRVDANGTTAMYDGVYKGLNLFDEYSNNEKILIVLTDGEDNESSSTLYKCKDIAVRRGVTIYSVGLGSSVDSWALQNLAESTGGKYYHASYADELYGIYELIQGETIDYVTDSNGDGISDYYTKLIAEGKLRDGAGNRYFAGAITEEIIKQFPNSTNISELIYQSIQSNDDFDGDGKKNGEELIISQSGNLVYIKMLSNPLYKNSDLDPFEDSVEINLLGHPFEYDIQKTDLNWLIDNGLYTAALSADRYIDSAWYRVQLGLGNYIYGGEYDWCYAAQKQLLECSEKYAENIMKSYEAIYISENFITITNDFMSEANNLLSTYSNVMKPTSDTHIIQEIMGYMAELTEARNELSKMDLSDLDLVVKKCEEISAFYSKIDKSTEKLSDFDFTEYTSLTKISLKVPSWFTKVSNKTEKVSNVLNYITATVDTIDEISSTVSGYGAITATSQSYSAMYEVLCELQKHSDIGFVSIAASELKASVEIQFAQMVSEASLMLKDAAYSWDEIGIDVLLAKIGPVGWAIGLGRGLGNLITGVGDTCKQHIYMIAVGEAGKASASLLDNSIAEKGDFYYRTSDTTLDYMILCSTLRIAGEESMIASSEAQSWLFEWINDHGSVETFCTGLIDRVYEVLKRYGLNTENIK